MRKIVGVGVVVLAACGGMPAPEAPKAPEVDPKVVFRDLGKGSSKPMVVDWSPEDRAALESRSTRGAVLVRITEGGIEPLWDCGLTDGSKYEFTGVSPKRSHVDARSDAELAANFPMSFAKLQAMVKSGQQITADVRLIGVSELNRVTVKRADLPPACATATHFVKELTIGGFQFGSSAIRAAGGGGSVGNLGAEVGYQGVANRLTEEGDFKVCEGADPEARNAPGRCKGVLRVRLVPIGEDTRDAKADVVTCAAGTRWNGKACVGESLAHECQPGDVADCKQQCERGNPASCRLAVNQNDTFEGAKNLFLRGCKGEDWESCTQLGFLVQKEGDEGNAARLYGTACLNGNSSGCTGYGVSAYFGRGTVKQDRQLAFKLWERACRLGGFDACSNAGAVVNLGEGGVQRDPATARQLFELACKNDEAGGCSNLAFMYENGIAGPKDRNMALKLGMYACEKGIPGACVQTGLIVEESAPSDPARLKQALSLYEKACNYESAGDGCASYDEYKRNYGNIYNEDQLQRRACDGSTQSELGCFNAAVVYANAPLEDDAKMRAFAKRACKSDSAKKDICKKLH